MSQGTSGDHCYNKPNINEIHSTNFNNKNEIDETIHPLSNGFNRTETKNNVIVSTNTEDNVIQMEIQVNEKKDLFYIGKIFINCK